MDSQDDTFDLPAGYGLEAAALTPATAAGASAGASSAPTGGM